MSVAKCDESSDANTCLQLFMATPPHAAQQKSIVHKHITEHGYINVEITQTQTYTHTKSWR